jgi:antitoxin HicB
VAKQYTVSDGRLVLSLCEAAVGGNIVTSPMDPERVTEAESVEEAFENARDALEALGASRAKLLRQLSPARRRSGRLEPSRA